MYVRTYDESKAKTECSWRVEFNSNLGLQFLVRIYIALKTIERMSVLVLSCSSQNDSVKKLSETPCGAGTFNRIK